MKKPKIPKPIHPSEMNGDNFQSPGGKSLYDMGWDMHGRISQLEATVRVGGGILLVLISVVLAKLFGAIPG